MNIKRIIAGLLAIFMIATQVPQAQITAYAAEESDVHENENTSPVVTGHYDECDDENCDGHDHEHIDGQQPGNNDPVKENVNSPEPGNPDNPDNGINPDDQGKEIKNGENSDNTGNPDDAEEEKEIIIEDNLKQLTGNSAADSLQYDYTVTFDVNGGDEEVASFGYNKGDTVAFETPVRAGYIFVGWYTDARFKTRIAGITDKSASNYDLIAKWTPVKYTIIFNKNDAGNSIKATGSIANLAMTYDVEKKLNVNKFVRKGYTFGGWMKKADGAETEGELIDFEDAEAVINLATENNAKVTLYAYWKPIEYTISYNPGGNGDEVSNSVENPATYTAEDAVILAAPVTTKAGFVFDGWYKENTYKTKVTEIKAGTTGNLTFYAKWITGDFKVKYDANGASGKMTPDTFKYGVEKALKANAFKKSVTETVNGKKVTKNYVFAGWSVVPADDYDSSEDYFRDKQVVDSNILLEMMNDKGLLRGEVNDNTTFENGEVTLYAVWRRDYTVSFDTMCDEVEAPETISYSYGDTVKLPTVTREGYTFAGWYTDATYKTRIASIAKNAATNYVLVAKWTPNKYTVIFNKNAKDATGSMANLAFVYDTEKELMANRFVRNGYKFIGWSTTADGGEGRTFDDKEAVENLTATNNGKVTLYAQWQATGYTITFDTNGGTAVEAVNYQYNAAAPLALNVENPIKDRYVFTGWYTDAACKKLVKNNTLPKGTSGHITLYAGWKLDSAVETFYITYYVDGRAVSYGENYARYSKTAAFQLPTPEAKAGYAFVGWYKDSALKSKLGTTIPKNTMGDLQLYAKWNSVNYKVSFNLNKPADVPANVKPSGKMGVQTLAFGQSKALAKNSFAIKGYKFLGWSTEPTGTATIANQQKITGVEFGDYTATATLYAQWEKEIYTITYVDPAAAVNNNPVTYSVTDVVTLENLSQFGNTFQGWYTDKNCKKKAAGITAGTTGNKTFYAKWYTMQKVSGLHFIHNYQWSETETETATLRQNKCTTCGLIKATEVICKHSWNDGTVIKKAKCEVAGTMKYTCANCGATRKETIPALEHNYEILSRSDAACTEEGFIRYECKNCGDIKEQNIAATGHEYQWVTTQVATYKNGGTEKYLCKYCGQQGGIRFTDKLVCEHDFGEGTVTRQSNCVVNGNRHYTCSKCGAIKNEILPKQEHNYYVSKEVAATCYSDGKRYYSCRTCGEEYVERIICSGHNYEWKVIKEATYTSAGTESYVCTVCGISGNTRTIPKLTCEHSWELVSSIDATCAQSGSDKYTCTLCGQTKIDYEDKLEHDYKEISRRESTCTTVGAVTYKCTSCKNTKIESIPRKTEHSITEDSEYLIVRNATCSQPGLKKVWCDYCEYSIQEIIPVNDRHSFDNGVEQIAPGCETMGIRTYTCKDCGYAKSEEIPALGHKTATRTVVAATYKEEGLKETYCSVCGYAIAHDAIAKLNCSHPSEYRKTENVIPATCTSYALCADYCTQCGEVTKSNYSDTTSEAPHHVYGEAVLSTDSLGKEIATRICTVCGYKSTTAVEGHTHEYESVVVKAATCKITGISRSVCAICGEQSGEDVTIPREEHNWNGEYVWEKEATCTESGRKMLYCQDCGELLKGMTVAKKKHQYVWKIIVYPTETSEGAAEYTCKNCGRVGSSKTIDKLTEKCTHPGSGNLELIKEATCSEKAHYKVTCEICGELVNTDYLDGEYNKENHVEFTSEVTKKATTKETGIRTYTCTGCGYSYDEEIPLVYCLHKETTVKMVDGQLCFVCNRCEEIVADATKDDCPHQKYPFTYELRQKADATHWGLYDVYCTNCENIVYVHEVHPYSEYHITGMNGEDITIYGYFDETFPLDSWKLTNEYRKENGLNELAYNYSCQEASDLRAIEASYYCSHTRPNGTQWYTTISYWNCSGENLVPGVGTGYDDTVGALAMWKRSPGHNANLLRGINSSDTPYRGYSASSFIKMSFDKDSFGVESGGAKVQNFTYDAFY